MIDKEYEGPIDVIAIEDEDGTVMYFEEELVIPYEGKEFAILVSLPSDECEDDDCQCHNHEEPVVTVARKDVEDGEEVYLSPTDEEFDAVIALYEELPVVGV